MSEVPSLTRPRLALVTGGAGFIGSNLVDSLIHQGWRVRVLDNMSSGYADNLPASPHVDVIVGDVRDATPVDRLARDVDVIFHLAASVGNKRSVDNPFLDSETNVLGTLNILEAARQHRVPKVVVSSSAGIFGELRTNPIDESHPTEPDTPYGASKLCQEKQCLAYARMYGFQAICLRYFNVYGPRQRFDAYGNVIPIFAFTALRGERLRVYGDGEQTRDFVNVADVVNANIAAAHASASGAFNIGSGSGTSINHLVALLRRLLGPFELKHEAPRPGDVRHSVSDIARAKATLGFAPRVGIEEGLARYVNWAQQEVKRIQHG